MRRVIAVLAASWLLAAASAEAGSVSAAARARARRTDEVAVLVALRAPAVPADPKALPGRQVRLDRLRDALLRRLPADEVEVVHRYRSAGGFAARVTAAGLERLAADPDVRRVDLDQVGHAALHTSVPQIRADRVHARGVGGDGTVIAVIDSGVEATHPDVAEALLHEECFCKAGQVTSTRRRPPCCPDGTAHQSGAGSAASSDEHGPHVTGIALSRGRVAGVGVAPAARLVSVRVLDDSNLGFLSDWIAALDWVANERPEVRVINMSLVSNTLFAGDCERECEGDGCAANLMFADVIDQLWSQGTLVIAASGNDSRPDQMTAPACVSRAVAVGAVNADDVVASFSNSSPTLDVLGPGVQIVSDGLDGGLDIISGTSMAAPHVTGLAALLLSARPGLPPEQVVSLLRATGMPVIDQRNGRMTPRIDAFAAFKAATRGAELERGGGSRFTDCLLEWTIVPPDIVRAGTPPVATCHDNDPFCDVDDELGRCTFVYLMCVNMPDPLLRACAIDEPLIGFALRDPRIEAPPGTIERDNLDALAQALPDFPFASNNACSIETPFIVERPAAGGAGIGRIRLGVHTATRRDYDHIVFECLPPE
jgi:subtilisin family serine protease